jgi:peroxiredoxin
MHKIKESTIIAFSLNNLAIKISAELHTLLSRCPSISTPVLATTIPNSSLFLNLKWDFSVFYSIGGVHSL